MCMQYRCRPFFLWRCMHRRFLLSFHNLCQARLRLAEASAAESHWLSIQDDAGVYYYNSQTRRRTRAEPAVLRAVRCRRSLLFCQHIQKNSCKIGCQLAMSTDELAEAQKAAIEKLAKDFNCNNERESTGNTSAAFCGVLWDGPLPPVFLRHQISGAMDARERGHHTEMKQAQAWLAHAAQQARQAATKAAAAAQEAAALCMSERNAWVFKPKDSFESGDLATPRTTKACSPTGGEKADAFRSTNSDHTQAPSMEQQTAVCGTAAKTFRMQRTSPQGFASDLLDISERSSMIPLFTLK
eukprot:SAG31_NODE_21_length_34109_cov_60.598824_35_plen_298_part_00